MNPMSQENNIYKIDVVKSDELGLKIVVAKDKNTGAIISVVTEVNPHGVCFKENVKPGDTLISINGTCFDSYQTLRGFASNTDGGGHNFQLSFQRKAAFDIPGLFAACCDSPCSELCKMWDPPRPKYTPHKGSIDGLDKSTKIVMEKINTSKFATLEQPRKSSNVVTDEAIQINNSVVTNSPKYKYQKAIPMKKREVDQRYKGTLKPKKTTQNHIIPPPQPLFIKRKNQLPNDHFPISNLTESKSLTNIANLSNKYAEGSTDSESFSSDSCDSLDVKMNRYVPKPVQQMPVPQQKTFSCEALDSPKNNRKISKSTDLLLSDIRQELSRLNPNSLKRAPYPKVPPPVPPRH